MKKIILFDMDGTLTPPRKNMSARVCYYLGLLQKHGYDIGIVSGSDLDYIKQQCSVLFDVSAADWSKIKYFPCNGTKYYTVKNNSFNLEYSYDMKNMIGHQKYNSLIVELVDKQSNLYWLEDGEKIPMSGTFIKYRGSMINWCPIGRDATDSDREIWVELDKKNKWRINILDVLIKSENWKGITFKLGGDTSFDIYPNGWDKTMALNHVKKEGYDMVYFVGDKCEPNGNDFEIYQATGEFGFNTSSPEETVQIIKTIIGIE